MPEGDILPKEMEICDLFFSKDIVNETNCYSATLKVRFLMRRQRLPCQSWLALPCNSFQIMLPSLLTWVHTLIRVFTNTQSWQCYHYCQLCMPVFFYICNNQCLLMSNQKLRGIWGLYFKVKHFMGQVDDFYWQSQNEADNVGIFVLRTRSAHSSWQLIIRMLTLFLLLCVNDSSYGRRNSREELERSRNITSIRDCGWNHDPLDPLLEPTWLPILSAMERNIGVSII